MGLASMLVSCGYKMYFAKSLDKESFELIYNINANERIFFNKLSLNLPSDFDNSNYDKINNFHCIINLY